MHSGCTSICLVTIGSRPAVLPRQRSAWLPRSVAVGEANETLNSGPPLVGLVHHPRVIQEQLSSRQSFCWSGGRQRRAVRGAGYARTSNYVRRSSIPPRRPGLPRASMLACMLVLNSERSTSLILAQQAYGTVNTMTLLVPRLLRCARCAYGRRGLRGLVFGLGSTVSTLVDARSSASVNPTARLLRWWRDRHGRNRCLRSLLLRWHVDEDDEDLARVHAGSGSHNLDAPLPGMPKMSGKLIHGNLWDRRTEPLSVRRRAEVARRADRGSAHEQFTQLRSSPER